jgi:hypothetical protein
MAHHFLGRLVPAALIAAAALGGSAVGDPTIAGAEAREWDVGAWDACMRDVDRRVMAGDIVDDAEMSFAVQQCCFSSGGVWDPDLEGNCGALPAVAADTPAAPPPEAVDPDVPTGPPASSTKPGPKPPTPQTTFVPAPFGPVG